MMFLTLDLAGGRIAQFHVDGDAVALHLDVLGAAAGHEILAGVGVDDFLQGGLDLQFGKGHGGLGIFGW